MSVERSFESEGQARAAPREMLYSSPSLRSIANILPLSPVVVATDEEEEIVEKVPRRTTSGQAQSCILTGQDSHSGS